MKANSILGCTDKGKCTFIVKDSSGALQPSICLGVFLKELDYLQFLLQQEGFVRLLKAFENLQTACTPMQLDSSGQCHHKALKWRFPKTKLCTLT